jgi:transcriptional regulator with XRE-family HTH domain
MNVGVNQHSRHRMWYWLRGHSGGEALAGVRKDAGLTQAELARRLGIDRTTVLNIEAGRNPAINWLLKAFGLFGYDLIAVPREAHVTVTFDKEE